jgi:hypothetical protein
LVGRTSKLRSTGEFRNLESDIPDHSDFFIDRFLPSSRRRTAEPFLHQRQQAGRCGRQFAPAQLNYADLTGYTCADERARYEAGIVWGLSLGLALLLIGIKAREGSHQAPEWVDSLRSALFETGQLAGPELQDFFVLAFVLAHPAIPRSNKAAAAMAAQNLVLSDDRTE